MNNIIPKNMYQDAIFRWNVMVGCLHNCIYCKRSFQAQMKRQLHNCKDCYDFKPHFHEERLNINFNLKKYETKGDQFIWVASSSDICFIKFEWMDKILKRVKKFPNRTFFFQTKNPIIFKWFRFPSNCLLGITLESDWYIKYNEISKAPSLLKRFIDFSDVKCNNKKVVTIEPILSFDLSNFIYVIKHINPERVYIGYDTKNCGLPEPPLSKTLELIEELKKFTKVKLKYMKGEVIQ